MIEDIIEDYFFEHYQRNAILMAENQVKHWVTQSQAGEDFPDDMGMLSLRQMHIGRREQLQKCQDIYRFMKQTNAPFSVAAAINKPTDWAFCREAILRAHKVFETDFHMNFTINQITDVNN